MTKKIIRCSGGNPSHPTQPQPTRAPDTLHSRQFATFLDLFLKERSKALPLHQKKVGLKELVHIIMLH